MLKPYIWKLHLQVVFLGLGQGHLYAVRTSTWMIWMDVIAIDTTYCW
jgi:hypothetical protein